MDRQKARNAEMVRAPLVSAPQIGWCIEVYRD